MIFKGIDIGNPYLGLLFKVYGADYIVAIEYFTDKVRTYSYNQLKELGELDLTVSEFNELHSCRTYVK